MSRLVFNIESNWLLQCSKSNASTVYHLIYYPLHEILITAKCYIWHHSLVIELIWFEGSSVFFSLSFVLNATTSAAECTIITTVKKREKQQRPRFMQLPPLLLFHLLQLCTYQAHTRSVGWFGAFVCHKLCKVCCLKWSLSITFLNGLHRCRTTRSFARSFVHSCMHRCTPDV